MFPGHGEVVRALERFNVTVSFSLDEPNGTTGIHRSLLVMYEESGQIDADKMFYLSCVIRDKLIQPQIRLTRFQTLC